MKALTKKEDELLATTPTEELLALDILKEENIKDTLHAYQLAKRCNEKELCMKHDVGEKEGLDLIQYLQVLL